GKKPRARIRAFANIGSEPAIMLTGPIDVTKKVLAKAGMQLSDIDLFELNEAFASVVLRYMQALDVPHEKMNVAGGAIAMGHPLGATGAMIFGTVLDELERRNLNTALITLCIGAGMGTATLVEDGGETILKAGDCAGFKANVPNGHYLVNKTDRDMIYLEIGWRAKAERAHYPDVDLFFERDEKSLKILHKNGVPY